jgi:hypothetical protein
LKTNKKRVVPSGDVDNFANSTIGFVNNKHESTIVPSTQRNKSNVPPLLLTFEIYNINVHNCMVISRASWNVMPLSVSKKINVDIKPSEIQIVHLDHTNVKIVGELKDVLITLYSNTKVYEVIDIIVAYIL